MWRRLITVLALVCAVTAASAAVATAAPSPAQQAIADCNTNGRLTAHYSTDTLKAALAQMPSDVREYTDCYDVIERQLFAELGNSNASGATGSSSSGSFLPTWLIVVIVVLALAAVTFAALAIRRRSATANDPEAPRASAGGSEEPPSRGSAGPGRGAGA